VPVTHDRGEKLERLLPDGCVLVGGPFDRSMVEPVDQTFRVGGDRDVVVQEPVDLVGQSGCPVAHLIEDAVGGLCRSHVFLERRSQARQCAAHVLGPPGVSGGSGQRRFE